MTDGFDHVPDVPDSCWTIRSISRNGSVRINIAKHLQLVQAETANALQRASVVTCHRNDDKQGVIWRMTQDGEPMTETPEPTAPVPFLAAAAALETIDRALKGARQPAESAAEAR